MAASQPAPFAFEPVTLSFRLPPVLMLRAPLGAWRRAPRGVTLDVGEDGTVTASCVNGSELYARTQVMTAAASFLRAMDSNIPPITIPAKMTAPSLGDRTVDYAISLGARVTIARTGEAPAVWGNPLLAVLNHDVG
jgi:hypothetical protein